MSRESLLDEAIAKAKEAEDWQLVEWLRMARGGESAAKWYTAKFDQLKAENAKLRELVRKYGEYTSQDRCEGCVCKSRCNNGDVDECWQLTNIRELERELGVPHEKE